MWPSEVARFHDIGEHRLIPGADDDALLVRKDPRKLFRNKERVGDGGFAEVFTCNSRTDGSTVAVKVFKRCFSDDERRIRNEVEKRGVMTLLNIERSLQIKLLEMCHHRNIVPFLGAYLWNDRVWVAMEYCSGGSLWSAIRNVELDEKIIRYVAREVLQVRTLYTKLGEIVEDDYLVLHRHLHTCTRGE